MRWAVAQRGAVPDAGNWTSDGWAWLYLAGRLPAKNRSAGAAGAGRKFFKPKRIRDAEGRTRGAFAKVFGGYHALSSAVSGDRFGVFGTAECEYRLVVFRRTPLEARSGQRNVARGDPASAHEFLIDALQGCFYANDEQLTKGSFEELRRQEADGYLFMVRPRSETP